MGIANGYAALPRYKRHIREGTPLSKIRSEAADHVLAAQIQHAMWAGRHLASWAIGAERRDQYFGSRKELLSLIRNYTVWRHDRWRKYQVHPMFESVASQTALRQLRKARWF